MECTPLFVLDLGGEKADLDGGFFMCSKVPWEMRRWKLGAGEMGGERGSWGEGRSAGDNSADFTVFHRGLPCLPLLTSKLYALAQSVLQAGGRRNWLLALGPNF